jgi:hypothetical protein
VHAAKSGTLLSLLMGMSETSSSFPSLTSSMYAAHAHGMYEEVLGLLDFLNPCLSWDWLKDFFLDCLVWGHCLYVEGHCPYVDGACWHGFSGHSCAICPKASQQKHFPCSLSHCLSASVEAHWI